MTMAFRTPPMLGAAAALLIACSAPAVVLAKARFAAPDSESVHAASLRPLVPETAGAPWSVVGGPRPYAHRVSLSPAGGRLGRDTMYTLRVAFHPGSWLGWEAALQHVPGHTGRAAIHTLSAQLRHPVAGRVQPYLAVGYGMAFVFPGRAVNVSTGTRNTLTAGGGCELYLRNDVALRGELRGVQLFGPAAAGDESVLYSYREGTLGLTLYRTVGP